MTRRTVTAAEFKAKCLDLVDQVATTGNPVTITRRGKPVAQLVPAVKRPKSLFGALKGHIKITGDIVGPVDVEWEANR